MKLFEFFLILFVIVNPFLTTILESGRALQNKKEKLLDMTKYQILYKF